MRTATGSKLLVVALVLAAAMGGIWSCATEEPAANQLGFESAEKAVTAAIVAARAKDRPRLLAIFGPDFDDVLNSGDEVRDESDRKRFLSLYDEHHAIENKDPNTAILLIGKIQSPFAIPIVKLEGDWYFDTEEGRQEILDRRIGRNELDTIQAGLAFCDAQEEYSATDRDGDGILEYAQRLRSSPGKRDGLYWPTGNGEEPSPLGERAARAAREGYQVDRTSGESRPFHGYHWRILTRQGTNAAGGAYGYLAGDSMIGGHAMVAWPAEYGDSGVTTFILNHDGVIFEKDLGEKSADLAEKITAFDPDESWKKVSVK